MQRIYQSPTTISAPSVWKRVIELSVFSVAAALVFFVADPIADAFRLILPR